jgi:hypothetical protein
MPSVATIGWRRTTATSQPLAAPTAMPTASRIGTAAMARSSPAGISATTTSTLMKPISGPIERSMPPLPERIG